MKVLQKIFLALTLILANAQAPAQESPSVDTVLGAVISLSAEIPPNARTADTLGMYRDGYGVVIGEDGLILTIGYLILEADSVTVTTGAGKTSPAKIVAYDNATGFGLLRTTESLEVRPMKLGDSKHAFASSPALVAGAGGVKNAMRTQVVSRRTFAGYWEYLLQDAIFTSPPFRVYGGAALIDAKGELIGIGSLFVNDASGPGETMPGNMFVPIDALKPILHDLIANGRSRHPPRPWMGLSTRETPEGLLVIRVSYDGPAQMASVLPGSIVMAVNGKPVHSQQSLYREVWGAGPAGTTITLTLIDPMGEARDAEIQTGDRYDWLRPMGEK